MAMPSEFYGTKSTSYVICLFNEKLVRFRYEILFLYNLNIGVLE